MKKIGLISVLILFTAGLVFSQNIKVVSPAAGEIVYKGGTYTIKWNKNGMQDSTVKINVFKESIAQPNFIEQLTGSNSGSLTWTVKNSYSDGNYVIRIKTSDNKVTGDSGVFKVGSKTPQPQPPASGSISVMKPSSGEVIPIGSTYEIRWNKTGLLDGTVKINIFKNSFSPSNFIEQLTGPNAGSYSWDVKNSYIEGKHLIRIKTADGKAQADSPVFTLKKSPPAPSPDPGKYPRPIPFPTINNTARLDPEIQPKNVIGKIEVITKFQSVPGTIEPGRYAILSFEYKNALSAEIENVNTGKVIRALGALTARKDTHTVYPTETTTYRLVVTTAMGKMTRETTVTVKGVMQIELFTTANSSQKYPTPGDTIELAYFFQGADYATIHESPEEKFITEIQINGNYKVDGRLKVKYMHPTTYRLTISRNNGKEFLKENLDILVTKTLSSQQGIKKFEIIPNWRFSETHVDAFIEVMGAKTISIFQYNKYGPTLRKLHYNVDEYKLFKTERKPFTIVPSKDFGKIYSYSYEVVYWDGTSDRKSFYWK